MNFLNKMSNAGTITKLLLIMLGAFIYSFSISLVLSPNNLAPGGISGVSIIINYITGFPIGTMSFILNIPLLIISFFKFGKKFFFFTIYAISVSSVFTDTLANFSPLTNDYILAALVGAALNGVGLGLIFKCGSTSGGTDIIVRLLKIKFPHIGAGILLICIDMVVVVSSGIVFKNIEAALYAAICVILAGIIMDKVLYGTDEAKLVYIISDKSNEIINALLINLEIGVTSLSGKGAYSNIPKNIVLCAMKKQNLPKVQSLIRDVDPNAFLIVSSATEIMGEGFKSHYSQHF